MVKIGGHFLRKETMPLSGKLAVICVERSQRRSLEAIVTHGIPRDKCLLYVHFATYDDTPLAHVSGRSCSSVEVPQKILQHM